jgi:hypothetical protein
MVPNKDPAAQWWAPGAKTQHGEMYKSFDQISQEQNARTNKNISYTELTAPIKALSDRLIGDNF